VVKTPLFQQVIIIGIGIISPHAFTRKAIVKRRTGCIVRAMRPKSRLAANERTEENCETSYTRLPRSFYARQSRNLHTSAAPSALAVEERGASVVAGFQRENAVKTAAAAAGASSVAVERRNCSDLGREVIYSATFILVAFSYCRVGAVDIA
jgi:hypothetical protein